MDPDELFDRQLEHVLRNLRAPLYLRARRRLAFFVGHRLGLVELGYLVDYDRDRYAGLELGAEANAAGVRQQGVHLSDGDELPQARSPRVPRNEGEVDA